MKAYCIVLAVLSGLTVVSCSTSLSEPQGTPSEPKDVPSEVVPTSATPESFVQEGETEMSPSLPIPAVRGIEAVIEKAKEDLAQRLSISASQIQLIESKDVFWPDASLGCPQPGTAYDQTSTPGYLIRLEATGAEFEYHANIHNRVFYCENPAPPLSITPTP